ncbi:MAG: urease accessory protein [Gammaproteobacteria bacterium]|nr:urease accessory protein UreD [Magnetovibrio sp.]PCI07450.1 MAG: urease accessory protein [Gammaproteobacteria bacterium]
MSAVTLPSDPIVHANVRRLTTPDKDGMHGCAKITFETGPNGTCLKDLYQASPLRVLFPNKPKDDIYLAAFVTTSGGLVGGDHLNVDVTIGKGAAVQMIGQAAEKVYRSKGPDTVFEINLSVDEDAYLEWLPQETIIFDQARLRRRTTVNVTPGGTFLGAEILVFGRTAMGETLNQGLVRDVWEVSCAGKLTWSDALHLSGDIKAQLNHPAGFDGACATASSVLVSDDVEKYLDFVRDIFDTFSQDVKCAATITNGVLVTRWLAADAQLLRQAFAEYWANMRHELKGLPRALPRLWHM